VLTLLYLATRIKENAKKTFDHIFHIFDSV